MAGEREVGSPTTPYWSARDSPSFVEMRQQLKVFKGLTRPGMRGKRAELVELERQINEMADRVDASYERLGSRQPRDCWWRWSRNRPRHPQSAHRRSQLPPDSRYFGPAREADSTGASCDCPTYEYPEGSRITLHQSPSCFSGIDAENISYNGVDLQAATFASSDKSTAMGEPRCECSGLVGSAFEAVMTPRGSHQGEAIGAFVAQWSEICVGGLPEPSGEAMPWECVHSSKHVSLFGPIG